jgi:5-formyltetrahydrofolate cyclo-ligase
MSDTGQPPGQVAARKRALRAGALAARAAIPEPVRAAAARRVQEVLRTELARAVELARAGLARAGLAGAGTGTGFTVASYQPVGSEPGGPDLPEALARALPPGGRVLLPVLCPDLSLDWAVYQPAAAGGGRPVRSATDPPGPRLGGTGIGLARLVVVPALAVDRRGIRLGRGGGSYDRALTRLAPGARVVALLHDGELVSDDLPCESHDRPVSAVIIPGAGLVRLPLDRPAAGAGAR